MSNANLHWVQHPIKLTGIHTQLVPLQEEHFDVLWALGQDESIWKYSPTGVNGLEPGKMRGFLEECMRRRDAGEWYPFVIVQHATGAVAGFSIYHSINPQNRSLEIGCTWFHPKYWGSGLNTESKYLMLTHCFETLGTMRVQLKASHDNARSRKAIEKIGATFEGILRKDKILEDGAIRHAAYYSIIDDEWPAVKAMLEAELPIAP